MVGFRPTDVPPTAAVKFVGAGTAACIADLLTFPLDTAKVRLQVLSMDSLVKCICLFVWGRVHLLSPPGFMIQSQDVCSPSYCFLSGNHKGSSDTHQQSLKGVFETAAVV